MKIAVINETSTADRNKDVVAALEGRGHTIINAGMKKCGEEPELTYIHTGLLAAILLNLKKVDLVVGGCGTGQGFLNSVMQYPNVFCGLIQNPLDVWLFAQINAGNCVSLALNYGYGWAGEVNLRFIFDTLFSLKKFGEGYPRHRRESQQESRRILGNISKITHKNFADIVRALDDSVLRPVLTYPGVSEIIDIDSIQDTELKRVFKEKIR